jgi:SulP family sulfate permease
MARPGIARWAPGVALLGSYEREWLRPDGLAALSVWALLIPQGLAYAQLAGMPPVTGLYVGMIAMLAYGLFGTSRYLNIGPESSVAILIASSLVGMAVIGTDEYVALAATLALLVGVMLVIGFVLRLGVITRLLSSPVLTGYLAGSAIVMSINQLTKVFGFEVDKEQYPYIVGGILHDLGRTNVWALGIAAGTMAVMVSVQLISKRLPAGFIALALATLVTSLTALSEKVAVVGTIKAGLPPFAMPSLNLHVIVQLLIPAASIALLVFTGAVLTGQALAARDREDLDANSEFVGLAAGNVAVAFFGGFPDTASDSRSFMAATGGGRSQMVSFVCAFLVALTLVFLTGLFTDVPLAALGGVVLVTAAKLFDLKAMRRLWAIRRVDFILMIVTFGSVVLFGVLGGIVIGVIASLVEMVRRTLQPRTAVLGKVPGSSTWRDVKTEGGETIPGLLIYRFDAPLFFGNADEFRADIRRLAAAGDPPVRAVLVNAEAITDLDTTGVNVLSRLLEDLTAADVSLSFARVRSPVREMMRRTGLEEAIGAARFFLQIDEAVAAFEQATPAPDQNGVGM